MIGIGKATVARGGIDRELANYKGQTKTVVFTKRNTEKRAVFEYVNTVPPANLDMKTKK